MKMKSLLVVSALLLMMGTCQASGHADGGASLFNSSGDAIQAIFQCPSIWKKVGGSVQQIVAQPRTPNTPFGASQFTVSTIENIAIVNSAGVTTGYTPTPCSFGVEVTYTQDQGFSVTGVDFSSCPKTSGH
jgi:hypothetical protein